MSTAQATLRARVRERDGDSCSLCGKLIDFTRPPGTFMGPSLEHVIPLAAGGTDDLQNLRLAHMYPCNQAKGARHGGVDYSAVRNPHNKVHVRSDPEMDRKRSLRRLGVDCEFESWSAARP